MKSRGSLFHGIWGVRGGVALCLTSLLTCCISLDLGDSRYDRRSIAVLYMSLFNQREAPRMGKSSWAGDWLFRRERLLLVDRFLRDRQPDILIFQESMARLGSSSESDLKIMSRGGLPGYDWDNFEVERYSDTQEAEYHGVAAGLPIKVVKLPKGFKRKWSLGPKGRMVMFLLEIEDQQIPVFNIEISGEFKDSRRWYKFIADEIEQVVYRNKFCPMRVVVSGRIPASYASAGLTQFADRLNLKDISEGMCEVASDCYTATPINEIYMNTTNGQAPAQLDRVLVHRSAFVTSSSIVLSKPTDDSSFKNSYGLDKIWPLERFGWYSLLRLGQCDAEDFLTKVGKN